MFMYVYGRKCIDVCLCKCVWVGMSGCGLLSTVIYEVLSMVTFLSVLSHSVASQM